MSGSDSTAFVDAGQALADLLCLPEPGKPQESREGYLSNRVVRGAARLVDDSGVMDQWHAWRDEDDPDRARKGGRPTLADERACLILLIALVTTSNSPLVSSVANAYRLRLHSEGRELLGLPRVESASKGVIYHRVRRALKRLVAVMDPYPGPAQSITRAELDALGAEWAKQPELVEKKQKRLVWFTNALLEASWQLLSEDTRRAWKGNICVDATLVKARGKAGSPVVKPGRDCSRDRMSPEYLAGWYSRTDDHRDPETPSRGTRGRGKYEWGYEAHLAVMTANTPGTPADFPLLVLGMSLDKPAGRVGENAVTAIAAIAERGHPTGVCASDRAYFPNARPEKFQLPVRALGYTLCGDYRDDQLGVQAEHGGALLVEGNWYCPSIPQPLIDATRDHRQSRISDDVYADRIAQRARYLFRVKQQPSGSGNPAYSCPARGSGATATCPLVTTSGPVPLGLPTTRTRVQNPPAHADICCTNASSISFPTTTHRIAKYRQDLQYGSPEWRATRSTLRNTVEGFNGYAKDVTYENLEEPGRRRARGYAFQALLVACLVLASNVRKIEGFLTKRAEATPPSGSGPVRGTRRVAKRGLAAFRPDPTGPPLALPV